MAFSSSLDQGMCIDGMHQIQESESCVDKPHLLYMHTLFIRMQPKKSTKHQSASVDMLLCLQMGTQCLAERRIPIRGT